ncbi:acyltransferase family protein [Sphingomonas naphthae]|uniref:Acyltransferase family protein n=1 Tax=Sphingomonas naphthae TaxID=1813468 RepID=A0ABY7TF91_9SPHN|nr:acyltransferase family protein [Sphingomonas naphthae]WCT71902.1 acyltransferase family protein [Sphingomonas naphthae]
MTPPAIDRALSDRIKIARVLCIAALIFVHLPPYGAFTPEGVTPRSLAWFVAILLGTSSVPLLSIFSGYLSVSTGSGKGWGRNIARKATTLLVPLLLWNLIDIAKSVALDGTGALPALQDWPTALLALAGKPAVTPLYFLRDVFVCAAIGPLVVWAIGRAPLVALAALALNAVFDWDGLLILNSAILLFFAIGCALALGRLPIPDPAGAAWWATIAGALAVLVVTTFTRAVLPGGGDEESALFSAISLVSRVAGATLYWLLSGLVLRGGGAARIMRIEPAIFFVFCAHPLVIGALWLVAQRLGLDAESWAYLAVFLIAPLVVMAVCLGALAVLVAIAPAVARWLMGGRATFAQMRAMLGFGRPDPSPRLATDES